MKLQSFEVVNTIGEFDYHHAHILSHSQKHFTQVFYISFQSAIFEFAEFSNTFDHPGDIIAKIFGNFLQWYASIFWYIMKQPRNYNVNVNMHFGQKISGGQRMSDIGFSGISFFIFVSFSRIIICQNSPFHIAWRTVSFEFFKQQISV